MTKRRQKKDVHNILTQEEINALLSDEDESKKEMTAEDLAFEEEMKRALEEVEKEQENNKQDKTFRSVEEITAILEGKRYSD